MADMICHKVYELLMSILKYIYTIRVTSIYILYIFFYFVFLRSSYEHTTKLKMAVIKEQPRSENYLY